MGLGASTIRNLTFYADFLSSLTGIFSSQKTFYDALMTKIKTA
jgi:hypothetical protein